MNKNEVKKLLKRREEMVGLHEKLENDSDDKNNSDIVNGIYKNQRNSINGTLLDIDKQLYKYVIEDPVGKWLIQIKGITTYLAAGLLAYFNVKNKDCAAQFIKYAGADNYNNPHNNNVRKLIDGISNNFRIYPESLYGELFRNKLNEIIHDTDIELPIACIRADRYMRKVFISHLFEEMYREENDGQLPSRYNSDSVIIEPEVPYTK